MVSLATIDEANRTIKPMRPLKGILKQKVQLSFAPVEFHGGSQDDYLYHLHIASVSDWYSRYPPVDGSKKNRVTFDDHRTVKVFLIDGPMAEWPCYPHHDPGHIRVSEQEYSTEDLEMINSVPDDDDDCPEQLYECSDSSSDTSSEGGLATPPLGPISTFDVLDIKFASRSWDDMMEEDEEIELGVPVLEKTISTTHSNIAIFDGLGTGIKGRRWDEDDEDDLPVLPMTATPWNADVFDGRGLGITGKRWDEDDEDEIALDVLSATISQRAAPQITIFDGLGTGIKGRRWDDDDDDDDDFDISSYAIVAAMAKQSQRNTDACRALGNRLKSPSGNDSEDNNEVRRGEACKKSPCIDVWDGRGLSLRGMQWADDELEED
ncbi:hypothetical protein JDV02_000400 [Purpureocillium takamizusanense]|uniref:Uncharacterized protein n=1 Tax=Purpureocillium takamizusanense TaxID=2060973 RepID=A0A9Q8Q7A2_9HYPO|nr:uncharacterized protein JDV02_000400 [Purpureocillium takamizusanense]UNI13678.1 hypothetical protein JDV02_000400 [Purpureocillium takamizusanense]